MSELVGIARERMYSPGKVRADHAILEAVAARLRLHHRVRLLDPDDRPLPHRRTPPPRRCSPPQAGAAAATVVFAMCQSTEALRTLKQWEATGARIINPPSAIARCRRVAMITALQRAAVPHPETVVVATDAPGQLPRWSRNAVWLKRGDLHATQTDDVVRLRGQAAIRAHLARFHRRGIATAILQRHVRGRVIKFYAVVGRFFTCFAAGARPAAGAQVAPLRAVAERAAAAVGLEVFGGDIVCVDDGSVMLIDLNDWPSYAPCRLAAANAIAAHVLAQCTPRPT